MTHSNIIDLANLAQSRASNPNSSVWVSASAGSGKTKVLTDRVLRMLLKGVAPSKIICLTFTKAAAGEMANRINESLKEWSIINDEKLIAYLKNLTNENNISNETLTLARRLFAKILDNPLNIQTLHSFCQKILKRFPLEADISPYFNVIEEVESHNIINDCIIDSVHDKTLSADLENLLFIINEEELKALTSNLISHRDVLIRLQKNYGDSLYDKMSEFWGVNKNITKEDLISDFVKNSNCNNFIKEIIDSHSDKTYALIIAQLKMWLDPNISEENRVNHYMSCFLNKDLVNISKNTLKLFEKYNLLDIATKEAIRCAELADKLQSIQLCKLNESLLKFFYSVLDKYENKKSNLSALDYNDLIFKTLNLLNQSDINPWIMFKLDGGIDHILIDEAQDTSPEFWEIIKLLTLDFFSGESIESDLDKTLFSVGDEKQSIYSFQGADVRLFHKTNEFFSKKIEESNRKFENVPMDISFRSLPKILQFVDEVFKGENANGVSSKEIKHSAVKESSIEHIEVWDNLSAEKSDKEFSFDSNYVYESSSAELMAKKVAYKIEEILNSKQILAATNSEVTAGDIMILLNTRKRNFLNPLYRELHKRKIPTEGFDRFQLKNELLTDDVVCLIRFLLMKDDDLSLAELLKTPFINMSEEELFNLAYERKGTVWEALQQSEHTDIVEYLKELLNKVDYIRPYEFINFVFNSPCPADSLSAKRSFIKHIGESCLESLEVLLNFCLLFEKDSVISMQSFLHEIENNDVIIKREFEKSTKVKILTIHGAKGLEAPIVFLPDTMLSKNHIKDKVFWNEEFPIWLPKKEFANSLSIQAKDKFASLNIEEYKRLLYVALTRAENQLYIGSYGEGKEESWYNMMTQAIESMGERKEDYWLYKENKTVAKKELEIEKDIIIDNYDFLLKPAVEESEAEGFASPSGIEKENFISPFVDNNSLFFKRGLLIHKLLEILPNCSDKKEACLNFLNLKKHNLNEEQIENISNEVLSIFNKYSYLFGENSFAEVPIIGEVNGKKYSGIIDRMYIKDNSIIIVDYKSNRPPANSADATPDIYKRQLSIYKEILQRIYPNKKIQTAIIWTNTSKLFVLEQ